MHGNPRVILDLTKWSDKHERRKAGDSVVVDDYRRTWVNLKSIITQKTPSAGPLQVMNNRKARQLTLSLGKEERKPWI